MTGADVQHDLVLVVDFGAQYAQLIARVHVRVADPSRDQLGVLGPEINNKYGANFGHRAYLLPMPTPCARWSDFPSVWSPGATMTSAFWNSLTVS